MNIQYSVKCKESLREEGWLKYDLREKGFGRIRQMDEQRGENSRSLCCMYKWKEREVCLHEVKNEGIGSWEEGVRLDLPCGHHRDALLFTQREC